jgi:uncharacterized membrane protein
MSGIGPWLVVAGAGALHGLNPAAGWAIGACTGLRSLAPIAAGQLMSVVVVAAAVPLALRFGHAFDPRIAQVFAVACLAAIAVAHLGRRGRHRAPGSTTAVGLWSFTWGMAQGAGWMLVPALVPLCAGDAAAREIVASGSLPLAAGAVAVHLAALLGTTAAMSALGARAWKPIRALLPRLSDASDPAPLRQGEKYEEALERRTLMRTPAQIAGHPIHPMLVAIPIGLWVFSLVADFIAMRAGSPDTWHAAALYTMVGGIIGALAAAVPGLIDLLSLKDHAIKKTALTHMGINLTVVALYVVNAWMRTHGTGSTGMWLGLSIVAICLLLVSGWLGGKMVYEAGVAVHAADTAASTDSWGAARGTSMRDARTTGAMRGDRAMAADSDRPSRDYEPR